MQLSTRTRTRGMTLIELMIVVSILGIIAAIVIPRFANANDTAKATSLASQINTVRKSLELYRNDHNDVYPTQAQLITNQWQALTNTTDITGDVAGSDHGPYFQKPPMNAFMDSSIVAADNAGAWQYDETNGRFLGVVPQSVYDSASDLRLDTNDLVVEP